MNVNSRVVLIKQSVTKTATGEEIPGTKAVTQDEMADYSDPDTTGRMTFGNLLTATEKFQDLYREVAERVDTVGFDHWQQHVEKITVEMTGKKFEENMVDKDGNLSGDLITPELYIRLTQDSLMPEKWLNNPDYKAGNREGNVIKPLNPETQAAIIRGIEDLKGPLIKRYETLIEIGPRRNDEENAELASVTSQLLNLNKQIQEDYRSDIEDTLSLPPVTGNEEAGDRLQDPDTGIQYIWLNNQWQVFK
jgi:hypothetical protein